MASRLLLRPPTSPLARAGAQKSPCIEPSPSRATFLTSHGLPLRCFLSSQALPSHGPLSQCLCFVLLWSLLPTGLMCFSADCHPLSCWAARARILSYPAPSKCWAHSKCSVNTCGLKAESLGGASGANGFSLLDPECFSNTPEPGDGLPPSALTLSAVCPGQPGRSKVPKQGCPVPGSQSLGGLCTSQGALSCQPPRHS